MTFIVPPRFEPPNYVKCPKCGWVHFTQTAEQARTQVEEVNAYLTQMGEKHLESYDTYLHCFKCKTDSATFVPAEENDAPMGATIQPCVTER